MPVVSWSSLARHAANTAWRDVDWARAQLRPHAGKALRVEVWPLDFASFTLRVSPNGDWDDASPDKAAPPDATLRLTPSLLPRLAGAPDKPGAALDLDGEAALVQTLRDLHDVLPLALEERLSSLIGPIAAHGIATVMRGLVSWPAHATERVGAGIAAYLTEESPALVPRSAYQEFIADVAALQRRVERLSESA